MGATTSRMDGASSASTEKLVSLLAASAAEPSTKTTTTTDTMSTTGGVSAGEPEEASGSSGSTLPSFSSVVQATNGGGVAAEGTLPKKRKAGYWWRGFERSDLPNPGSYDEMQQETQLVLHQPTIEGLQFSITLPQTASLSSGVAFDLGARERPGQFAVLNNYFTNKCVAITRFTPGDGHLNGRVFYKHTPALTSKLQGEVAGDDLPNSRVSWELDYRGSDYVAQSKIATGGVYAVSYLQSVTPWLALGGEGFFQSKSGFSAVTFAGKYSHDKDTATVSAATFGPLFATYARKVSPKCTLATELFVDGRTRDSQVSLGYRFDLQQASVTGIVDSGGRVAAIVEEKINPGFALTLSAELDHVKEEYKFGFGVTFGQ